MIVDAIVTDPMLVPRSLTGPTFGHDEFNLPDDQVLHHAVIRSSESSSLDRSRGGEARVCRCMAHGGQGEEHEEVPKEGAPAAHGGLPRGRKTPALLYASGIKSRVELGRG